MMAAAEKPGCFAQDANGVARVLPHGLEEDAHLHVAHLFLDLFDPAGREQGGAARLGGGHAGADVFVRQHVDVAVHLRVEIAFDARSAEQVAPGTRSTRARARQDISPPLADLSLRIRDQAVRSASADRDRDALPLLGFGLELTAAGLRQLIELRAAAVLGFTPRGAEPAGFFEAMEGGEERSRFHLERPLGDLLDPPRHAEPVQLAGRERLQDQQIERPLQQIQLTLTRIRSHASRPPIDTLHEDGKPPPTECQ